MLISDNNMYGLTRYTLLSTVWHENNPEALKHLFGFVSRKDIIYKLHALFGVLLPSKMPNKKTHISIFEQYLIRFLRICFRMTIHSIAMIWGRKNEHIVCLINKVVKSIGHSGKHVSTLDSTPENLRATCPQQYKYEGLEKCNAVPDGNNFIIYTTREKNHVHRSFLFR